MAETLADFLSRKIRELDENTSVPSNAPNSEAAAEIYGSRMASQDGHRIIGNLETSEIDQHYKEVLNDYAEELTGQNNTNSPDRENQHSGLTKGDALVQTTEYLYSQDKKGSVDNVLASGFHNTNDKHLAFSEDALTSVRGNLLPGQKAENTSAAGWVRNSGISSNKRHGDEFSNPLIQTVVIPPDEETHPVEHSVYSALMGNNRFSPSNDSPYISGGAHSNGLYSFQSGIHSEDPQTSTSRYDPNARTVTLDDMKKIADDILLAAVGHPRRGIEHLGTDLKDIAQDMMFKASNVQLAASRVEGRLLHPGTSNAAETLGIRTRQNDDFLTGDGIAKADLNKFSDPGSFGVLNSSVEPFSAPLAMGMIWPTIYLLILLLALSILIELFFLIPGWSDFAEETEEITAFSPENLEKGVYGSKQNFFVKLLYSITGLSRLDYFFLTDLSKGIQVFFGLPTTLEELKNPEKLFDAAMNLLQSPGYYLVILRAAIRDVNQINEAFAAFSGLSFAAGLNQIFEILSAITTSTTWRFFIRLIELGDIWYKAKKDPARHADSDQLHDFVEILTGRSRNTSARFGKANKKTVSTLSLHTFPAALLAGQHLGQFAGGATRDYTKAIGTNGIEEFTALNEDPKKVSYFYRSRSVTELRRLSASTVKMYEEMLGQEYMPFYFHDLRTNEVVGLPAFIVSLSDSFSVNYNDTQGMGRTDPIKIYNNTTRSIDFVFKLVAMNKTDHDYMWTVVNKLVTMIYPQRSRGRLRSSEFRGVRFIQPFSQNVTASPMVRIRLGEYLHSNYSIDSFARMMGYPGELDTQTGEAVSEVTHQENASLRRSFPVKVKLAQGIFNDQVEQDIKNMEAAKPQTYRALVKKGTRVTLYGAKKPKDASGFMGSLGTTFAMFGGEEHVPIQVVTLGKDCWGQARVEKVEGYGVRVQFYSEEFDGEHHNLKNGKVGGLTFKRFLHGWPGAPEKLKDLRNPKIDTSTHRAEVYFDYDKSSIVFNPDPDKLSEILRGDVKMTDAEIKSLKVDPDSNEAREKIDKVDRDIQFIRSSPFYYSFSSTKGAGMAGFITSFSISSDQSTWNTDPSSRAPNAVEISIAFSPVHDMTPGLDFTGRQIAPVYPVGDTGHVDVYENRPEIAGHLVDSTIQKAKEDTPAAKAPDKKPPGPTPQPKEAAGGTPKS